MDVTRRWFLKTAGTVGAGVALLGPGAAIAAPHEPRFSEAERWDIDYDTFGLKSNLKQAYDAVDSEVRLWMTDQQDARKLAFLLGAYGIQQEGTPRDGAMVLPNTQDVLDTVREPGFHDFLIFDKGDNSVITPSGLGNLVERYNKGERATPIEDIPIIETPLLDQVQANQEKQRSYSDGGDRKEFEQFIDQAEYAAHPDLPLREIETPDGGTITIIDTLSNSIIGQEYDIDFFDDLQSFSHASTMSKAASKYVRDGLWHGGNEVNVLYPAAGSHIASLEFGIQLLEQSTVDHVYLTMTEVDNEKRDTLQNIVNLLENQGLFVVNSQKTRSYGENGEETEFELTYTTGKRNQCPSVEEDIEKKITITYALNRTGRKTMNQSQMDKADVFMLHDSQWNGAFGGLGNRIDEVMQGVHKSGRTDQVVISEAHYRKASNVIPGMWGHTGDHPEYPGVEDHLGVTKEMVSSMAPQGVKLWKPSDKL